MAIDWASLASLEDYGFEGFVPIRELRFAREKIPGVRGVYVLLRVRHDEPRFVAAGTGGHFKGKDPNVAEPVLLASWVADVQVVYIGKAGDPGKRATLRSRLSQYLRFGAGGDVGHWGGRYVWQLADAEDLLVGWKPLPDGEPSQVESELINQFRLVHGRRPFANLTK